ncbi:hypothetical protein ID866_7123 [Astraeus odoratus]|nr:hypothetical protein ID866_7123 [Astraeus odoratus]
MLARNLSDIADVIFVSDHGMGDTSVVEWVYVDDQSVLGTTGDEEPTWEAVTHADGWPSMGLRFQPGTDQQEVLRKLTRAAQDELYHGKFDVFVTEAYIAQSSEEDGEDIGIPMPESYHYSANERIAPIWIVPRLGYALTTKDRGEDGMSIGNHGYDNNDPAMHAIFVAHGPFSTGAKAKANSISSRDLLSPSPSSSSVSAWHSIADGAHVMQGFQNVEIYNLVLRLLGISEFAAPTNGTFGFWDDYLEM